MTRIARFFLMVKEGKRWIYCLAAWGVLENKLTTT